MADRALLHRSNIGEFAQWLIDSGWTIESPNETFKVLQARLPGRKFPLMVYDRLQGAHYSVLYRDEPVVRAFIKYRRGKLNGQAV